MYVCIYIGWLSLFSGQIESSIDSLDQVLKYSSTLPLSCLNIWAQELDIIIKSSQCEFEKATLTWGKIKNFERKAGNFYFPTTCAIIAFSLARDKRYAEAQYYALYACSKLATRQHCNMIVGVILFCGIYAALDIIEFLEDDTLVTKSLLRQTELGAAILDAIKRLELMCKSFPCLILLHLSIETRMSRLFNTNKCKLILNGIDNKYISINDEFTQFIFGNAFFHLQRSLLCKHLSISDITKEGSSFNVAKKYFSDIGIYPSELTLLSQYRHTLVLVSTDSSNSNCES